MKEYRDQKIIKGLLKEIAQKARFLPSTTRIMEVCGTHTMTIHKYGLKNMLAEAGVEMVSGPGCPVCITPNEYHESAIRLVAERDHTILATFGDMTRVPTHQGSLQAAVPASGSAVKIIYSPEESLDMARRTPGKEIVFFGVGFETTIPSIALMAKKAFEEKISNYSILSALWLIPPPLRAIVESKEIKIMGFLYPGHVSAIIGQKPYEFIARDHGIPGAIAGFEPGDILLGISSILGQIQEGRPRVSIEYSRVVRPEGNRIALDIMEEVLETKDAFWRGLGLIPQSGLRLKKKYSFCDAEKKFDLNLRAESPDLPGCRCGDVLRGLISPPQCPLFAGKCSPDFPFGPCMVSFEGACLVYYKYSRPGSFPQSKHRKG
ncbi:MAG: hydrogenase formation protein HypD [Candidatus Aminicenantales bacterium]